MDSGADTAEAVGCPIRKSTDQSLLAAPHGLSQRAASFIASQCQGIHQMPLRRLISDEPRTHRDVGGSPSVFGSIRAPPLRPAKTGGLEDAFTLSPRPVPAQRHRCRPAGPVRAFSVTSSSSHVQDPVMRPQGGTRQSSSVSGPDPDATSGSGRRDAPAAASVRRPAGCFLRKEVIQPQVPLRLPCYDFTPVADLTVVGCLLAVSAPASGKANSHGVTGGVYKARERIHRGVLIRDY